MRRVVFAFMCINRGDPNVRFGIKMRKPRNEQMFSGVPQIADIARRGWHGRKVPKADTDHLSAAFICNPLAQESARKHPYTEADQYRPADRAAHRCITRIDDLLDSKRGKSKDDEIVVHEKSHVECDVAVILAGRQV